MKGLNRVLPCVGNISGNEIASLFINLKFNVTNRDFGPGRAGENLIGSSGNSMPVDINGTSLKDYGNLPGGLTYLITHEIAHGLAAMQTFNQQMWTQYINGAGQGLTPTQQAAQYPSSAEFQANEARANTVGKGIADFMQKNIGFTPTNDYAIC